MVQDKNFAQIHKKMSQQEKTEYRAIMRKIWFLGGSMVGSYSKEKSSKIAKLTGDLIEFETKMTEKYGG